MRGDRRRSVAVIVRVDRLPFGGGPLSCFVAVSVLVFFDEVLSEAAAHEDARQSDHVPLWRRGKSLTTSFSSASSLLLSLSLMSPLAVAESPALADLDDGEELEGVGAEDGHDEAAAHEGADEGVHLCRRPGLILQLD